MSEPTPGNPGGLRPPPAEPALTGDVMPAAGPTPTDDPALHAAPAGTDPGSAASYGPGPQPYLGPGLPYPVAAMPYGPAAAYPTPHGPAVPYPMTGVPYPYALTAPPPRRRTAVIVLGIATGVLLLAAGALGVLWYLDHDQAAQASAGQQAQIDELTEQVAQLEDDLEETESQLQQTEDDLAGAQECPDAVQAFVDLATEAALAGEGEVPPAQVERAAAEMIGACGVTP